MGTAETARRHPATHGKNGGVRCLFGAYAVHANRLHGRPRPHKPGQEVLAFYRQIRMRYRPKIRSYPIADNRSATNSHRDQRLLKVKRRLLIAA